MQTAHHERSQRDVSSDTSRMIALFGGRFDPVHNGHVAIAQEVLKAIKSVDEVWLVPDNHHHWNPTVAPFTDRLAMLQLVEQDPSSNAQGRIKASDIGYKVSQLRNGMTVTIDVIRTLQGDLDLPSVSSVIATPGLTRGKQAYTNKEIASSPSAPRNDRVRNTYIFIAGSDQIPRLHEWHEYKELHMRLPFLIFPRKGYQTEGELPEGCMWLSDTQFEPMDDSATRVRQYLKEGKDIADLVPKKVAEYIKEKELYQ